MPVTLPCQPGIPHYEFSVVLDGVTYVLEFRWSTREACWYLDVKTEAAEVLIAGLKVVIDFPLGRRGANRQPPGCFLAIDLSGERVNPTLDDLGKRVILTYFSEAELPIGGV